MVNPAPRSASLHTLESWANASPEATAVLDLSQPGCPALWLNPAMKALVGDTSTTVLAQADHSSNQISHLLGIDETAPTWVNALANLTMGVPVLLQCRAYRQQREAFWADICAYRLPQASDSEVPLPRALITVRDLSALWLAEKALNLQTRRNATLLNEVTDAVLQADSALVLTALNPAAETLTGWSESAATGRPVADVIQLTDTRTGVLLSNPLLGTLLVGESTDWTGNATLHRVDGSQVPVTYRTAVVKDAEGLAHAGLLLLRNDSEATLMADTLAHLAGHDALTDLPNRHVFNDRLEQSRALAQRHNHHCALLMISVPHYSDIVEADGQAVANDVLQTLALHLRGTFRRSDTVCHLGNALFGVVLPLVTAQATVEILTAKAQSVAGRLSAQQHDRWGTALRVGVALFPQDGATATDLLEKARVQL